MRMDKKPDFKSSRGEENLQKDITASQEHYRSCSVNEKKHCKSNLLGTVWYNRRSPQLN
jgi:hypothetical protein